MAEWQHYTYHFSYKSSKTSTPKNTHTNKEKTHVLAREARTKINGRRLTKTRNNGQCKWQYFLHDRCLKTNNKPPKTIIYKNWLE